MKALIREHLKELRRALDAWKRYEKTSLNEPSKAHYVLKNKRKILEKFYDLIMEQLK